MEKDTERVKNDARYVLGDAADLDVLKQAGIDETACIIITTHDDDEKYNLPFTAAVCVPTFRFLPDPPSSGT